MTPSLSELPITDTTALYLRPLCGAVDEVSPSARIAGAWAGFDGVEVIARDGAKAYRAWAGLGRLGAWSVNLGAAQKARIDSLVARITDQRPAMAGITFDQPRLMAVLNVTPDSFSDGGDYATAEAAIPRGRELVQGGAAILDIGGESTQPGSDPVPEGEELRRVLPVIEALADDDAGAVISIDSRKAEVMEEATAAGAAIINDISALTGDGRALSVAASSGAHVILTHCQGEPKTMQEAPAYDQPPLEIFDYLERRIQACEAAGIGRGRIAVDPGIGFGKALAHNLAILSHLSLFQGLGCPVLMGVSRKSFIGHITGEERPKARLPGSLAATMAALNQGVQMVRVHDAAETRQALQVWQAIHGGGTID